MIQRGICWPGPADADARAAMPWRRPDQVASVGRGAQPDALGQELRLVVNQIGDIQGRHPFNHRDEIAGGHMAEDLVDADGEVPGPVDAGQAEDGGLVRARQAAGHRSPPFAGHTPCLQVRRGNQAHCNYLKLRLPTFTNVYKAAYALGKWSR
jgi:hypothetical protein